ncbi:MAG TPA: transporter substrate-binding domain-containing protein [Candidatus Acidoferrales bacterium]|nr:transporter substrate-binding domain-containing protein [Candidatus Acidoferrales bacterium]
MTYQSPMNTTATVANISQCSWDNDFDTEKVARAGTFASKGTCWASCELISCAIALAIVLLSNASAHAQTPSGELRVGIFPVAPFVIDENGVLTGFSVDLWDAIAARLKLKSDYQVMNDTSALFDSMKSNKTDIVISPVYITSARDAQFDFSYPIGDAGLGILVRDTGESERPANPLLDLVDLLLSPMILVWLGIAAVLILIPAHILWLLDRRSETGITHSERYLPGIFHAMIWAATALVSQVQELPGHWLARILALVWMFAGVVFVAFYTAQLSATLTVQKIRGAIESPADLPGKKVATIANSTAVAYLREHNVEVVEFAKTEQMFSSLLQKKVDAVVSGAPVLLYYAAHDGKGRAKMVGPQFNTAPLAMMFQLGSPLRKKVDNAMMSLRENGTYQHLYEKWFGSSE